MKNQIFRIWLIVIITVSPIAFFAQTQQLSFHHLSPEEGLSQASNDYIYHDSKGFVWLSSIDGLNRFDGKKVKIYKSVSGDSTSLLGNIITSNFYEDEKTNLWFTTYEGLHCYIRERDHFQHFQIKDEQGVRIQQDYYVFHLDEQKKLWMRVGVGETGKLYLFDIESLVHQYLCPIDGQRHYPILNEEGTVTQIVSCYFYERKGMDVLQTTAPFNATSYFTKAEDGFPMRNVIRVNPEKERWYLGTGDGLVLFDPKTKQHRLFFNYEGEETGVVRSTLSLNDTILWVATSKKSILIFNKKREQFVGQIPHEPQRKFGLHYNSVNTIYKDHQENVWLSIVSSGVSYANINKRKFKSPPLFQDRNMKAIFETRQGALFCNYTKEFTAYFKKSDQEVQLVPNRFPENIPADEIKFFVEDEDNVWAFTGSNLLRWNPDQLQFEYVQKLPAYSLSIHKNRKGRILFGTFAGIFEWSKNGVEKTFTPFAPLKEYQTELATAIYEDPKGRLYLALDASRLLILESDGNSYSEVEQIEGIGYAKAFHEEDQYLWVATSTGILKINKENLFSGLLNEVKDGAPNESYYSILADEAGSFWLSCNRGIIRYFPNEKKHRRYTLLDGLQANEYNTNSFLKTNKGEILMGGVNGLNRFFPKDIQDLPHPPKVQITRLQVNDEPFETAQQIGELKELNLAHYYNTISFDFIALEYSDPENNQIQYQLEGHEDTWVDAGKDGFARYSNIGPGDYIFKLKAANSDGVWNEEIHRLKISIATPWWKTWWFYALCFLVITGIVYGVVMYRLQQALKIERMRVKISSDLHDDVGGLLAGLTMQTEILELTASPERKPKLQRIGEMSRNAMSRMRDTVWAIDARKDKFENLLDRIREHAMETLEVKNIAFDLQVEDIELDKNMSSQVRQNLYLICKEAITNAAKHSNGNQLQIKFVKQGRKDITLTIHDNGEVENKNQKVTGLGLSNMEMRAKQIGGKMSVDVEGGFLIRVDVLE